MSKKVTVTLKCSEFAAKDAYITALGEGNGYLRAVIDALKKINSDKRYKERRIKTGVISTYIVEEE